MSFDKERTEFAMVLCGEIQCSAGEALAMAKTLCLYAGYVERFAIALCNRQVSAEERKRSEWAQTKIIEIVSPHGITVDFTGDPRGYTTKLILPKTKRYNTWGGAESGYGIPVREYNSR